MKPLAFALLVALSAGRLAADPSMREKITAKLASPEHSPKPLPTAKQMVKLKDAEPDIVAEATVKLPDFVVTAPLITQKDKVELKLAKMDVARRQEEANVGPNALSKFVSPSGNAMARERLKLIELQETIILTSLATSEKDAKELWRLLAKDRYPTLH
jgi:hypothetical protein